MVLPGMLLLKVCHSADFSFLFPFVRRTQSDGWKTLYLYESAYEHGEMESASFDQVAVLHKESLHREIYKRNRFR